MSSPRAPGSPRFALLPTRQGPLSLYDAEADEVMHPEVGPAAEAQGLYVEQSRLGERLRQPGPPLELYDVGLGAASNALAALQASEERHEGRPLHLTSFERDLGPLAFALEHPEHFGLQGRAADWVGALLAQGEVRLPRSVWRLQRGDALAALRGELGPLPACELVFWDPYSPKANPALWTVAAFSALRRRCAPRCSLYTYSAATAVRSALLLAGFAVGVGRASGPKSQTTCAALGVSELAQPLGARWLSRLARSSAPFPADAPPDALGRIRNLPQFAQPGVVEPGAAIHIPGENA